MDVRFIAEHRYFKFENEIQFFSQYNDGIEW